MVQRMFWVLAALLYGSAALVLTDFNWSFWVLLALGTLAAVIGNTLSGAEPAPPEMKAAR